VIELLLDPRPTSAASEYNYHRRKVELGAELRALALRHGDRVADRNG